MSIPNFTTNSITIGDVNFNGGLNTTGGPLSLKDTESPDLQNIDFNKFGSIVKRNGYTTLNTVPTFKTTGAITAFASGGTDLTTVTSASHGLVSGTVVIQGTTSYNGSFIISSVLTNSFKISTAFVANDATGNWYEVFESDGLHWFEFNSAGSLSRKIMNVSAGKIWKMDDLDATWDDITAALTITTSNHMDFENFLNEVYMTNGTDLPVKWTGTGNAVVMDVPSLLTKAKFVKQFNNYLFLANVFVNGTQHGSRIYWSGLKNTGTWSATHFIEIALNDGQEITGIKVLADRLVIYKSRSIYNVFFTGDADIPFILPGGGKSGSQVGCAGGFTIQEVNNGHVFLSYDGFYFYDGANSFKISDKINATINALNTSRFNFSTSINQKNKNRYWCSFTSSGQSTNDRVIIWDYFNNAWSIYTGIAASSLTTIYLNGTEERPYFSDYSGSTYRSDLGTSDNPLGVATAISAYYITNWRSYNDLVNQKGIPQVSIYYQNSTSVLTLAYAYDFEDVDQFSQNFSLSAGGDVYGTGAYGTALYGGKGGATKRRDLTGRGRVVRFKFQNTTLNEVFQIDGMGTLAYLETNV